MDAPLLSVCLITYNHEKFIRQTIESILMQKVNFSWELIIAEDCSPDNTRAILLEYKEKYPDFIKLILQEKNVGPAVNWMDLMAAPKSKYIAYIEGDDYWNDDLKLQKQVDFLESNPDYVISFHDANVINEQNQIIRESKLEDKWKSDFSSEGLIKGAFILPLTMCFRNIIPKLPDEFYHVKNGDTFFISILGFYGKAKFQSEITPAAYREHIGGVWSLKSEINKLLGQRTTYYHMFSYYFKLKKKNIGVDFYFNCYQNTCFSLFQRFVENNDFKNGCATYLKFVFNCIKFNYFKSIYDFTKRSVRAIIS